MPATTTKRHTTTRAARAAETRQRLIDTAIEEFSTKHYDAVTVGEIAKSAGVAHGLLFHYFGNKRGIYLEAMREAARNLDVSENIPTEGPAGERIRALFSANLHYLAEHRGLARRLVLGGRGADPEAWELFEADRWRAIEWAARLLRLDPTAKAIRMMLRTAVSSVDEAIAYWIDADQPFDADSVVEALVDLTATSLRCAARLDPTLAVAVDEAIRLLELERSL
ncbi:TetR/AcrR family transcriptional regulator [Nocardia mikamii]|uniref:TetR/AcrR family transcriptional regulator n=1 Tax=Nocardia mikamii TaxID=508464 RepID=UPI0009FEA3A5|nr:TetR/AcrR family transcriptional regulator [Nocardia mikamii]